MAAATATSPSSPHIFPPFPKLLSSQSLLLSANHLPFSHQTSLLLPSHHIHHRTTPRFRNLKSTIRHAKLNGGGSLGGELLQETEEALFDFDVDEVVEEEEEESEEDEDKESNLDLLFRFLHSMFKKASKRAKKATRSMLPPAFSSQLVSFAVDGILLLTLLSVAKALLEVVCTLGGSVFFAVLLLRVIWATASHFQSIANCFNEGGTSCSSAQPVT